ncbi:MAG: hypothetical protein US76_01980 [Parcubacteria group bacterium GW2011_GWA2_38_13b]|nr:MAG: hypothetical protein US76_01980 [Parcubacteria group bacterium GW2011_GWA2_38_13b]
MNKKSQIKNAVWKKNFEGAEKREFSYEKQVEDRKRLEKILKVFGKHNVYNALAALTAARALGIADEISFKALAEFRGTWRRFEEIGNYKGALVISDYAHNPQKIKALAEALFCKMKTEKRQGEVILVFQPHHQKRLETLFDDFVEAFGEIAREMLVIITDVYEVAGREKPQTPNPKSKILNSKILVEAINKKYPDANVVYASKKKIKFYINKYLTVDSHKISSIVFVGAGDIDNFARRFLTAK